jgi:hypothetical protein
MHESLQPPKLEKSMPKPKREKHSRIDNMAFVKPEHVQLFAARDSLDKEIEHLQTLHDLALEGEERDKLSEEIKQLQENRDVVMQSLGKARPEEFGTEAAFESVIRDTSRLEKRKALEAKEKSKDELEDASRKLKGRLRLLTAEHKQMVGKNMARAHELETEMREVQTQFEASEAKRLEAWKDLAELDPDAFESRNPRIDATDPP